MTELTDYLFQSFFWHKFQTFARICCSLVIHLQKELYADVNLGCGNLWWAFFTITWYFQDCSTQQLSWKESGDPPIMKIIVSCSPVWHKNCGKFQPFTSQNTAWFSDPWKSSCRGKGVRCHSDLSRSELATSKLWTSHLILWATTASGAFLPSFILKCTLSTRTSVSYYLSPSKNT